MKKLTALILTAILTVSLIPTVWADNTVAATEVEKARSKTSISSIPEDLEGFNRTNSDKSISAENIYIRYNTVHYNYTDTGEDIISLFKDTDKTKISEITSETRFTSNNANYIYKSSGEDYHTGELVFSMMDDVIDSTVTLPVEETDSMRLFFSSDDIAEIINDNKLEAPEKIMFLQLDSNDYLCENNDGGVIVLVNEDSEYAILNAKYDNNRLEHYLILEGNTFVKGMQGDFSETREAGYKNFKAEKAPEFSDISNDASVSLLTRIGIINGYPDGTFGSDKYITRAEAAKIISVLMHGSDLNDDSVSEELSTLEFSDVPDDFWAKKYIRHGAQHGYIDGKEMTDETYTMEIVQGYTLVWGTDILIPDIIEKTYNKYLFCPQDSVTEQELAKMLVCAVDIFGDTMAEAEGGWPEGYISVAKRLGICENASDKPATRLTAAHMIKNALDANVNTESSYISHNSSSDSTSGHETIYAKGIFYSRHTSNCKRVKLEGKITEKNRENEFKFTVNSDTKFQFGSFKAGDEIALLAKYGDLDSFIGKDCSVYCILQDSNLVAIMAE